MKTIPWDDASRYAEFQSIRISRRQTADEHQNTTHAGAFAKSHFIATVGNSDESKDQTKANAARIVACVNALIGIEDPAATLAAVREALESCKQLPHYQCFDRLAVSKAIALLPATTEDQP